MSGPERRWTKAEVELLTSKHRTLREAAAAVGLSVSAISKLCNRYGVKRELAK